MNRDDWIKQATTEDLLKKLDLLWDEIEDNREENRSMENEADRITAELDRRGADPPRYS